MRDNSAGYNGLVCTISFILAFVSCVLILIGFTNLGQMKIFRFVVGEMAVITAIVSSFRAAYRLEKSAFISSAIWFCIASIFFMMSAWPK